MAQLLLGFMPEVGAPKPEDGNRRPVAPVGFGFFKWKNRGACGISPCPNCGNNKGYSYRGGGWQHPPAQKAIDRADAKGIQVLGAMDTAVMCDGVPILSHWSRFGTGNCVACLCALWNDFGGDWYNHHTRAGGNRLEWFYYYEPKPLKKERRP